MAKLTLIRGVSGSGKTTLAKKIQKETKAATVSADDFFELADGTYAFNFRLLKAAHAHCLGEAFYYLIRGVDVVVHNTLTQKWEIFPYIELAHAAGIEWEILEPKTKWRYDAAILAEKNVHGLTAPMIQKMLDRWDSTKDILDYAESQNWTT
jgi:predicted kinase